MQVKLSNGFLYLITVGIWGATWIAIEFQIGEVPAAVSVFYRYMLAAAVLFGWSLLRRLKLAFDASAHRTFAVLGAFLFSLNYVLTYHAQQHITSALAAIAFSSMLWMNIVNARMFFSVRISGKVVAGAALGVCGICWLFLPDINNAVQHRTLYGVCLAVTGAYIASLGNMVSQAAQKRELPVLQSNAWGMFYGAVITGAIAALSGESFSISWTAEYLWSLGYLSIFGSIIAFGSYLTLLGRIGAHKAGYATVMFPLVAIVISAYFEDMTLSANVWIGIAMTLAGNLLVLQKDRSRGDRSLLSSSGALQKSG